MNTKKLNRRKTRNNFRNLRNKTRNNRNKTKSRGGMMRTIRKKAPRGIAAAAHFGTADNEYILPYRQTEREYQPNIQNRMLELDRQGRERFLNTLYREPEETIPFSRQPVRQLRQPSKVHLESEKLLDTIFIDNRINILPLINYSFVVSKSSSIIGTELGSRYNELVLESRQSNLNLEVKESWIGWTAIANAINPEFLVEPALKGSADVVYMCVNTVFSATDLGYRGYQLITPLFIQKTISRNVPPIIMGYGIEGNILLKSLDSGSFSSIIGMTYACLTNTDWTKKENIHNFNEDLTKTLTSILPGLFEDITKEGCKTLIPAVISQVVVEGSLLNIVLNSSYDELARENTVSGELIENLTDFGNIVVPLISQHMNKNGINCDGDLINDKDSRINCLGPAGCAGAEKFFNKSLKLITGYISLCVKEKSKNFFRDAVMMRESDYETEITEELEEITRFNKSIDEYDFSTFIGDKITDIFLSSLANDVKDVRITANERLNAELNISSPYASIIRKFKGSEEERIEGLFEELEELVDPTAKHANPIFIREPYQSFEPSEYINVQDGKVSIERITTKFDVSELWKLLCMWGENIGEKIGEDKPYSQTVCLLEVIDLRLPHLLAVFLGVRDENALEFADAISSRPFDEVIKNVVDDFVKPMAITMCIKKYIKPENYNELKFASLFCFFLL